MSKRMVEALLKELFANPDQSAPDAADVLKSYLRPFAILLCIGSGHMISYFVEHPSLQDRCLPFSVEPQDFPVSTSRNLFRAFYEEQWKFCALRLEYNRGYRLPDEYILPIISKEQIGDGGSANLYKIVVDESYNSLVASDTDAVF